MTTQFLRIVSDTQTLDVSLDADENICIEDETDPNQIPHFICTISLADWHALKEFIDARIEEVRPF